MIFLYCPPPSQRLTVWAHGLKRLGTCRIALRSAALPVLGAQNSASWFMDDRFRLSADRRWLRDRFHEAIATVKRPTTIQESSAWIHNKLSNVCDPPRASLARVVVGSGDRALAVPARLHAAHARLRLARFDFGCLLRLQGLDGLRLGAPAGYTRISSKHANQSLVFKGTATACVWRKVAPDPRCAATSSGQENPQSARFQASCHSLKRSLVRGNSLRGGGMPRLIRLLDIAHAHGASARLHAQARSRGPSSGNADGGTKNKLEELHFRSKVVCVVSRESSQIELLLNLSASFNNNNIFPATALRGGRTSYLPDDCEGACALA